MTRLFLIAFALCVPETLVAVDPTIIDASGKEIVLKKWRLATGTRQLGWLDKNGSATPALVFRETNSTTFRDGVLTFIPLDRLQELSYDADKQLVHAKLAGGTTLEGSTRYQGINQVLIEADIDKGEAGIVELKYRGGVKGGIKGLRFPQAKPAEAPKGEPVYIVIADGKNSELPQAVHNLRALYRIEKEIEKLLPTIMFKKTFRVDLSQVKRMTLKDDAEQKAFECEVTLKDGPEQSLTLLTSIPIDGKTATLEGLLAEVPAGYKLFPLHTIAEISHDKPKPAPAKPDTLKKKDD